jgi:hypothetical protein
VSAPITQTPGLFISTIAQDAPVDGGDFVRGLHGTIAAGQQLLIPIMQRARKIS